MSACARLYSIGSFTLGLSMISRSPSRIWPLYAVNFFMADMQSGIGPFVGVFLQERGWATGLIGTDDDRQWRGHAGNDTDRRLHRF